MSYQHWLEYLESAEKESSIHGVFRRISYKFPDGKQMIEEYNMENGLVERRAWRRSRQLMSEPEWEIELGDKPHQIIANKAEPVKDLPDDFLVMESSNTPLLSKRITKQNIEWRIRNLPYPLITYSVKADVDKRVIIIKTSNKKYYKVLSLPELERCNISPEQSRISVHHQYNTLIITYRKPDIIQEMEAKVLLMLKNVQTDNSLPNIMKQIMGEKK